MRIGIIGCGNMGKALAPQLSLNHQLEFYDHNLEKAQALSKAGYGTACADVVAMVGSVEMIILAVKPYHLEAVAKVIKNFIQPQQMIVSLLAGVSIEKLRSYLGAGKLVHMMPNLAIMHGEGVVGLTAPESMLPSEREALNTLFKPLGKTYWLAEDKIEALGALAGSGPAFIFVIIEAMVEAGIAMGLSAKQAQEMSAQTMAGALALLDKTGQHPGELKWQVTSPKGTTIEGIRALESKGLRSAIIETFLATYERSRALSKGG